MATDQQAPQEKQEDIDARLALISKAVEEKLASRQKTLAAGEAAKGGQNLAVATTCPVDPMERLLCEGCQ